MALQSSISRVKVKGIVVIEVGVVVEMTTTETIKDALASMEEQAAKLLKMSQLNGYVTVKDVAVLPTEPPR